MTFRSVLFDDVEAGTEVERRAQPAFFTDLNLDQVLRAMIAKKDAYNLATFFYSPLRDLDTIRFRQEIFGELERADVYALLSDFADRELVAHYHSQRRSMREDDMGFGHYHRARSFLNAAVQYCETIERLTAGLDSVDVRARGMVGLRDYLARYGAGEEFAALSTQARSLDEALDQVRYSFLLKGSRITVGPFDEQADYSAEVSATFERFRQDDTTRRHEAPRDWDTYAGIALLHLVAKVYPEPFAQLDAFCARHASYLDHTVSVFDRELQFYFSYLAYIRPLRAAGLSFSYPAVSSDDKTEQALDTFDLALAAQLTARGETVVYNDVRLDGCERVLVISGPNNGGKTTLARTIGQLHYLARLGCPIPGRDTRLFCCDQIFTRFERQEDITTLSGKLQDELNRLHDALREATPDSLFILNEMFNSTTAQDALSLSRKILARISDLDALCVCVTFLDELATLNEKTVSMVSSVRPDDPAIRTYKLVRQPADGRAYARAIAEKYGLTYDRLIEASRQ
jgi:DNA mismatch repair protein MutS